MTRKRFFVLGGVLCLATMCCSSAWAQTPKTKAWQEILAMESKAYKAKPVAGRQQEQLYGQAARMLDGYLVKYRSQMADEEYLRMLYRRGLYAQNSGHSGTALIYYKRCQQNPKIHSVKYNNKPLDTQLNQHLTQLEQRLAARPYAAGKWTFYGKGSIRVVTTLETPEPPSLDQQIEIATGLCAASDLVTAKAVGEQNLARLVSPPGVQVSPLVAEGAGLIVFSVGGTATETQELADRLNTMRRNLVASYFSQSANLAQSSMLYIYANLLPYDTQKASGARVGPDQPLPTVMKLDTGDNSSIEELGQALSHAVHYDAMSNLEGYYQPLDNSIVLRKGLRSVAGQWYLGTAEHEMVHALMQSEYPESPLWLDEGMAALHEVMDGNQPLDNYRLYYLLEAIEAKNLPSVTSLLDSDSDEWQTRQPLMAAMARYFCFYLQQLKTNTNALKNIYQKMRDQRVGTNSLTVLQKVTGMKRDVLEQQFTEFVKHRNTDFVDANWGYLRGDMRNYILGLPITSSTEHANGAANAPAPTGPGQNSG